MPTVFENENGFTITAEAKRGPEEDPPRDTAPDIPSEVPEAYRRTLAWLVTEAQSGMGSETTLSMAKCLLDKVLTDFQRAHPDEIDYVISKASKGFFGFWKKPATEAKTPKERIDVLRKAGFVTEKFVQLAGECEAMGQLGTSGPEHAKKHVSFLKQLIFLLYVTPARAGSHDPQA